MHKVLPTNPFQYKMIQGIDFYQYVAQFAKTFEHIDWVTSKINSIQSSDTNTTRVDWEGGAAIADYVFSSIQKENIKPELWQHFKGIVVKFEQPVFDDAVARFMDFNVPQKEATAFMYLLPMAKDKALVEYTLFSPDIFDADEYDEVLDAYLAQHFNGMHYALEHTEIGAIPMTAKKYGSKNGSMISIGTSGDAVKASTGFAFQFIQQQAIQLVQQLKNGLPLDASVHHTRHHFYDAVLLYILEHKKMQGDEIFARIFNKNKAATIFNFLSNSSTLLEDIQIMRSLPTSIFLPAAIRVLFRR